MDTSPERLGKYEILREIGRGGFAVVYLARDMMLGRQVALKVLAQHRAYDPEFVRRFQQEAHAAASLNHPNIVTIFDVGSEAGRYFLAEEYVPGRTLADLLKSGPLPLDEAERILAEVASALDHAHGRGLIHRDVKPNNIMITDDGHVKLMDFGLVRAADGSSMTISAFQMEEGHLTTGAVTMGTPEYMSPEQADFDAQRPIDRRSDVYALGVVAYQMITGRVPFGGATPLAVLRGHADGAPKPPTDVNQELPAALNAVLLRALAKSPDDRYPTAGSFAQAFTVAVEQGRNATRQQMELAALYEQAESEVAAGRWARALALCGQVMAADPGYRSVGTLFDRASQALAEQRAWEAQQAELEALYREGSEHLAAGRMREAIRSFEALQARARRPYRDADAKLGRARAAQAEAEAAQRKRLAELYTETRTRHAAWQESATQVKALEPNYPDPDGVLVVAASGQAPPPRTLPEPWRSLFFIGLAVLLLFFGIIALALPATDTAAPALRWTGWLQVLAGLACLGILARVRLVSRPRPPFAEWAWVLVPLAAALFGGILLLAAAATSDAPPIAAVITRTHTPTPTFTPTPTRTTVPTRTLTPRPTRVPTRTPPPAPTATATRSPSPTATPIIISTGPDCPKIEIGEGASLIATLDGRVELEILGLDSSQQWFRVRVRSPQLVEGWIARSVMELCGFVPSE